jgi:hypothetical protein
MVTNSLGLAIVAGLIVGLLPPAPAAAQHGGNPQPMPAAAL